MVRSFWHATAYSLAILTLMMASSPGWAARSLAFVVGIDNYLHVGGLSKAGNDAKAVARTLDELGYAVTLSTDVDRLSFKGKWRNFLQSIKPGDTVVFYFAGHGAEIQGVNYLLQKDIPHLAQGAEIVRVWAINFQRLKKQLEDRKPKATVYILDACRDNPFRGVRSSSGTGVAIQKAEGAFILYSAGDNQQALDWLSEKDPNPNSVFTRYLVPLITQKGLTIAKLSEQLSKVVAETALTKYRIKGKSVQHIQRPAFYNGLSDDFCLAGCAGGAAIFKRKQTSEAGEVWQTINNTNSRAVLNVFIERFPNTIYAAMARARREELGGGGPNARIAIVKPPARRRNAEPSNTFGKRSAFVMGNDQYVKANRLQYAGMDARAVADKLRRRGHKVHLLLDATRSSFFKSWARFIDGLDGSTAAFAYFSGHGVEVDGENFILATDSATESKIELKSSAISLSSLLSSVRDRLVPVSVFLLDTCRDNPFSKSARGLKPVRAFTSVNNPIGTFVMYSSGVSACGIDALPGKLHSPFATAVLKQLDRTGLSIQEFARYVQRQVRVMTQGVGQPQTPAYYDSLVGDFCLTGNCRK